MLQDIIIYSQIKKLRDLNCTMKPWHSDWGLHRIERTPHPEEQKNQRGFYIQGYWILLCVLILYLCYKCIFLYALEGTCKDVEWIFFLESYFILVSKPLDFLTVANDFTYCWSRQCISKHLIVWIYSLCWYKSKV